jgi:hypothetical protein
MYNLLDLRQHSSASYVYRTPYYVTLKESPT